MNNQANSLLSYSSPSIQWPCWWQNNSTRSCRKWNTSSCYLASKSSSKWGQTGPAWGEGVDQKTQLERTKVQVHCVTLGSQCVEAIDMHNSEQRALNAHFDRITWMSMRLDGNWIFKWDHFYCCSVSFSFLVFLGLCCCFVYRSGKTLPSFAICCSNLLPINSTININMG